MCTYFFLFECMKGRTPGKKIFGLIVIGSTRGAITLYESSLRLFFFFILPILINFIYSAVAAYFGTGKVEIVHHFLAIGFGSCLAIAASILISRNGQGIHDKLSGTIIAVEGSTPQYDLLDSKGIFFTATVFLLLALVFSSLLSIYRNSIDQLMNYNQKDHRKTTIATQIVHYHIDDLARQIPNSGTFLNIDNPMYSSYQKCITFSKSKFSKSVLKIDDYTKNGGLASYNCYNFEIPIKFRALFNNNFQSAVAKKVYAAINKRQSIIVLDFYLQRNSPLLHIRLSKRIFVLKQDNDIITAEPDDFISGEIGIESRMNNKY